MPKNTAPTVYITVQGGNVQHVFSTDPNIKVEMIDWDNAAVDENIENRNQVMHEIALQGHKVF